SKLQDPPLDTRIIMSFKKYYHRHYIRWILEYVEKDEYVDELKIDMLKAIQFIIQGWDETIDPTLDNLINTLEDLHIHLVDPMLVKEFLSISVEDVVYKISKNNQVIKELIKTFRPVDITCDDSEDDNSIEIL
ncbi:19136_t:CDS:2, partial [Dentiscutata erythropus]